MAAIELTTASLQTLSAIRTTLGGVGLSGDEIIYGVKTFEVTPRDKDGNSYVTGAVTSLVTSTVSANSGKWEAAYNSVYGLSADWSNVYTQVRSNSADWSNVYTQVRSNSAANWDNDLANRYTHTNFLPLTGGTITGNLSATGTIQSTGGLEIGNTGSTTLFVDNQKIGINTETPNEALTVVGNVSVSGNVTINQNLSVLGETTFIDTKISTVSAVLIDADTSETALRVIQKGSGDVIRVDDQASDTTPFIVKADGRVGVGIESPLSAFHVVGGTRLEGRVAEGFNTIASGSSSHAEGSTTVAQGNFTHAEGQSVSAIGGYSHAEGCLTIASGIGSHAAGTGSVATGDNAYAQGTYARASGTSSHAEGRDTIASGNQSHAEGLLTQAIGGYSHAEGRGGIAVGLAAHAENWATLAIGGYSHAEGQETVASGNVSHSEGLGTVVGRRNAYLYYSASTNVITFANTVSANFNYVTPGTLLAVRRNDGPTGLYSFIVASRDTSSGAISGQSTTTLGSNDSLDGWIADDQGIYAHAEGYQTQSSGQASHAEGWNTIAENDGAHAEGFGTRASGFTSHAEGGYTQAIGGYSHAEGFGAIARGQNSHAAGQRSETLHRNSWVWYGPNDTFLQIPALSSDRIGQFKVVGTGGVFLSGSSGVGINTDSVAGNALTVAGNAVFETGGVVYVKGYDAPFRLVPSVPGNLHNRTSIQFYDNAGGENWWLVQNAYANAIPDEDFYIIPRAGTNAEIPALKLVQNGTHRGGGDWSFHGTLSAVNDISTTGRILSAGVDISSLFGTGGGGDVTRAYVHTNFLPLTGGTISGDLTVVGSVSATDLSLATVKFTSEVSTATNNITATNSFLKIEVNGVNKYLRLFDI